MVAIWSERAEHGSHLMCLTEDAGFVRFCWRSLEPGPRAHGFADGRAFIPITTDDVLSACVTTGALTTQGKADLLQKIRAAGRPCIGPGKDYR